MVASTGKRVARVKVNISKRAVDALEPADTAWIAWDDRLTGFGVRVYPSGRKSYIVTYRAGDGGRKAPSKRMVL
ncbi:MAG: integrase arm-type DNA-binding domain-containing protein, partial [Chloroflexi bacterium]|nr:integrase arm-type DNA-binding domain-containing protein [Chloroflexota bacterium]